MQSASKRQTTLRSLQTVRSEINERVASQMRPSLRLYRTNQPQQIKDIDTFLRVFIDKKTRMISLDRVYASMRALGMQRQLDLIQRYFDSYTFKTPGCLSEQEYIRIIDAKQVDDGQLFNFFDCNSEEGAITPEKLIASAQNLGVQLGMEQAKQMICCFSRNRKAMDKHDFMQMLSDQKPRERATKQSEVHLGSSVKKVQSHISRTPSKW